MSVTLVPIPPNRVISQPHSKMRRLLVEASVRSGVLVDFGDLKDALGVAKSNVSTMFGSGREHTGSVLPDRHWPALLEFFRQRGVPLEQRWFYQPLPEFEELLRESRDAAVTVISWPDIVWRYARTDPALWYRAEELRLRRRSTAARPGPMQFHIGEPVRVVFAPPLALAADADALHAVLLHADGHAVTCLSPLLPGASAMPSAQMILPDPAEEPFEVTGPAGPQHVYALLTRFEPRTQVHAELEDAELRLALDVLASELAGRTDADWGLYQTMVEVVP